MNKFIKHGLIYLFICLPLQLIGIPLVALAVLCQKSDAVRLPKFLKWFDLADNYPEEFGRTNVTYVNQILPEGKLARFNYLALRNPTNYFNYKHLAVKFYRITTFTCVRTLQADYLKDLGPQEDKILLLNDIGDTGVSGISEIEIDGVSLTDAADHVYEYYNVYRYKLFGRTFCVRIRIGWKLSEFKEDNVNKHLQWVFVISPFHGFTGYEPKS